MSKQVRIGIIGSGGMARHHMGQLKNIEGVEVTALCDINPSQIALAKETYPYLRNAFETPDYKALLAREDVDDVRVAVTVVAAAEAVLALELVDLAAQQVRLVREALVGLHDDLVAPLGRIATAEVLELHVLKLYAELLGDGREENKPLALARRMTDGRPEFIVLVIPRVAAGEAGESGAPSQEAPRWWGGGSCQSVRLSACRVPPEPAPTPRLPPSSSFCPPARGLPSLHSTRSKLISRSGSPPCSCLRFEKLRERNTHVGWVG